MQSINAVKYPWAFRKALIDRYGASEFLEELCSHYTALHQYAGQREYESFSLKDTNLRLKHENEFMLRLINAKENNNEIS